MIACIKSTIESITLPNALQQIHSPSLKSIWKKKYNIHVYAHASPIDHHEGPARRMKTQFPDTHPLGESQFFWDVSVSFMFSETISPDDPSSNMTMGYTLPDLGLGATNFGDPQSSLSCCHDTSGPSCIQKVLLSCTVIFVQNRMPGTTVRGPMKDDTWIKASMTHLRCTKGSKNHVLWLQTAEKTQWRLE